MPGLLPVRFPGPLAEPAVRLSTQRALHGVFGDAAGGQGHWPSERLEDRHVPEGGNGHGKLSSWVLVAVVTAAFITGGLAIITHIWWLLWACFGVVVLAVPAGKAIGIMDDTVAWGSNPAASDDRPQDSEAGLEGTSQTTLSNRAFTLIAERTAGLLLGGISLARMGVMTLPGVGRSGAWGCRPRPAS